MPIWGRIGLACGGNGRQSELAPSGLSVERLSFDLTTTRSHYVIRDRLESLSCLRLS